MTSERRSIAPDLKKSAAHGVVRSHLKALEKTVVITGANQGIGYETALDLAGRGARVVMACRNVTKGDEAKDKILKLHPDAEVVVIELDLASLASVRKCAKVINETESRIDVLINNAGVMCCPQWKTKEGYEFQLGVNHIGHFLFTNLLLDLIKRSAPSRIVIVTSSGYKQGIMKWNDMMNETDYRPFKVYFNSKLANVHHCMELSRRLEGTNVTCNCLHPGLVKTNLGQHMRGSHTPFVQRWLFRITWPIALLSFVTPKQGAQTSIFCAIAPEIEGVTGKYFSRCAVERIHPHALKRKDAERLWKMSEDWVRKEASTSVDPKAGKSSDGDRAQTSAPAEGNTIAASIASPDKKQGGEESKDDVASSVDVNGEEEMEKSEASETKKETPADESSSSMSKQPDVDTAQEPSSSDVIKKEQEVSENPTPASADDLNETIRLSTSNDGDEYADRPSSDDADKKTEVVDVVPQPLEEHE